MYVGLLILVIGLVPLMVSLGIYKLYGNSGLTVSLFLYFLLISLWQIDVAILYLSPMFSEEILLFLFKLFRIGQIFSMPSLFLVAYSCVGEIPKYDKSLKARIHRFVFNKYFFIGIYIWTLGVYLLSWTSYGIKGLEYHTYHDNQLEYLFPIGGEFSFIINIHYFLFIFVFISSYINITYINDLYFKSFMKTFSIITGFLFFVAILNIFPETALISSSVVSIMTAMLVLFSFINMYNGLSQNYNKIIERQNKLDYVGSITSSLIHEVKNSLAVMKGCSEILPAVTPLNEDGIELTNQIVTAGNHLSSLVKNYYNFIKYEEITFQSRNLITVIEQSKKLSNDYLISKKVEFTIESPKKVISYINETYMVQIFINLIKNSTEAMSLERDNKINIKISKDDDSIIINYKDTGAGIPENQWDKVFYPFQSLKEDGFGLGLPFCKKVIFGHRGTIHIKESSSEGTCFEIRLPKFKLSNAIMEDIS